MARTIKQIKDALEKTGGNVSRAAEALEMSGRGLRQRIADNEDLREFLTEQREAVVDLAEDVLLKQLKDGNLTAAIFIAKTQGRSRGYSERVEMTGADGGPIIVKGYISVSPDDWDADGKG